MLGRIFRWGGAGIGLAVLGLILFVMFIFGYHKWIWYSVVPHVRYMEVKIDLTLDGEPVEMRSVTRCRYHYEPHGPLAVNFRTGFRPSRGVLAKRLSDGRGLVIMPGTICQRFGILYGEQDRWHELTINAFRDFHIYLLDDADDPQVIGYPILPQYLEEPDARIKIQSIRYREPTKADPTDPTKEVGWLEWPENDDIRPFAPISGTKKWVGLFASLLPREDWSKVEQISKVLGSRKTPSADIHETIREHYENLDFDGLPFFEDWKKVSASFVGNVVEVSTATVPWWVNLERVDRVPYMKSDWGCGSQLNRHFGFHLPPLPSLRVNGRLIADKLKTSSGPAFDPVTGLLIEIGSYCMVSTRLLK